MSERSDAVVESLIACVRRRPLLWSRRDSHPGHQAVIQRLWDEVLVEMRSLFGLDIMAAEGLVSVHRLKVKWRGLRSCFKRYQRNQPDGDGANWKWAPLMHFVDPDFVPPQDSIKSEESMLSHEESNEEENADRAMLKRIGVAPDVACMDTISPVSISCSPDLKSPFISPTVTSSKERSTGPEEEDEAFVRYIQVLMKNVRRRDRLKCQLEVIQTIHKYSTTCQCEGNDSQVYEHRNECQQQELHSHEQSERQEQQH